MKLWIGSAFAFAPAVEDALGDTTAPVAAGPIRDGEVSAATGLAGSPLLVIAAAGLLVRDLPPSSRRLNASAVHANGAVAGRSPLPPERSHDDRLEPNPVTAPGSAAAAVITGAASALAGATDETAGATAGDESLLLAVGEAALTAGADSEPLAEEVLGEVSGDGDDFAPAVLLDESVPAEGVSVAG